MRWRHRRRSLRGLLWRLVALLAAMLAILMLVALVGTLTTSRDYRAASQRAIHRQASADAVLVNMLNAQSANRAYILLARGSDRRAWNRARARYQVDMGLLRRVLTGDDRLLESADRVDTAAGLWQQEALELISLRSQGQVERAVRRVDTGPGERLFDEFRNEQTLLLKEIDQRRRDDLARNDHQRELTLIGMAVATLLALLVVALASRQVWRRVGRPIDRVGEGVQRVAVGRLGDPVTIDADKITEAGMPAVQINTGGDCHLDAVMISYGLQQLNLEEIDLLMDRTEVLTLCLDASHIALVDEDPVTQFRKYSDRLGYIHLKDWARGKFVEMGQGTIGIDFAAILDYLAGQNFGGWVVIENSRSDVSPFESARINADFLTGLGYSLETGVK